VSGLLNEVIDVDIGLCFPKPWFTAALRLIAVRKVILRLDSRRHSEHFFLLGPAAICKSSKVTLWLHLISFKPDVDYWLVMHLLFLGDS